MLFETSLAGQGSTVKHLLDSYQAIGGQKDFEKGVVIAAVNNGLTFVIPGEPNTGEPNIGYHSSIQPGDRCVLYQSQDKENMGILPEVIYQRVERELPSGKEMPVFEIKPGSIETDPPIWGALAITRSNPNRKTI